MIPFCPPPTKPRIPTFSRNQKTIQEIPNQKQRPQKNPKKCVLPVRFELTHLSIVVFCVQPGSHGGKTELKTTALDHSAKVALFTRLDLFNINKLPVACRRRDRYLLPASK